MTSQFMTGSAQPLRSLPKAGSAAQLQKSGAFGDRMTVFALGDLTARAMAGRDGDRVIVEFRHKQHAFRNIVAFLEGLPPVAAFDRVEPVAEMVAEIVDSVRDVLGSASFAEYEESIAEVAVQHFNRQR